MSDILTTNELKKKFAGVNTLDALVEVIKEELGKRISYTDIVNDLISEDESKPLSAAQGKVLKEMIDQIELGGPESGVSEEKIKELIAEHSKDFLQISQVLTLAADGDLLSDLNITDEELTQEEEEEIKLVSAGLVKVIALSITGSIEELSGKIDALEAKADQLQAELAKFEEISGEELQQIWNSAD